MSLVAKENELEWFSVLVGQIWHERNRRLHGYDVVGSQDLVIKASVWWEGLLRVQKVDEGEANTIQMAVGFTPSSSFRKWEKPENGFLKLNIDAAIDIHKGIFGTGAVVRDEQGKCVGVLASPGMGVVDPQACEAVALVNGLHFCAQAGVSKVVIEGDAQNVFAALDDTQEDFSFDGGILDEAKVFFPFFSSL
ncbi:hypothetical protein ACLB2K_003914 [Fragaria x ananassa]